MEAQPKNPLHGITLEQIIKELVGNYGWEQMAKKVKINCFMSNPTINSSLKFLRKNQWARTKVEKMYVDMVNKNRRKEVL
jgi:uncharacterized protein (DUF2132 family)